MQTMTLKETADKFKPFVNSEIINNILIFSLCFFVVSFCIAFYNRSKILKAKKNNDEDAEFGLLQQQKVVANISFAFLAVSIVILLMKFIAN